MKKPHIFLIKNNVKGFEESAIDLLNQARRFEKEFELELEDCEDAPNLMQEAVEYLEAVLKSIRFSPDNDGGDTIEQHQAMEGRPERFI